MEQRDDLTYDYDFIIHTGGDHSQKLVNIVRVKNSQTQKSTHSSINTTHCTGVPTTHIITV